MLPNFFYFFKENYTRPHVSAFHIIYMSDRRFLYGRILLFIYKGIIGSVRLLATSLGTFYNVQIVIKS